MTPTLSDLYHVLCEIRDLLKEKKEPKKKSVSEVADLNIRNLIGIYISSWQKRYQTKARPEITKAMGVFKALRKDRTFQEVADLLQVYCQMDDPWFLTKRHDIVTFRENIGKIALARDKGMNSTDINWQRVFGGEDGENALSITDRENETNLGRKSLPGGETSDFLEDLPDDT